MLDQTILLCTSFWSVFFESGLSDNDCPDWIPVGQGYKPICILWPPGCQDCFPMRLVYFIGIQAYYPGYITFVIPTIQKVFLKSDILTLHIFVIPTKQKGLLKSNILTLFFKHFNFNQTFLPGVFSRVFQWNVACCCCVLCAQEWAGRAAACHVSWPDLFTPTDQVTPRSSSQGHELIIINISILYNVHDTIDKNKHCILHASSCLNSKLLFTFINKLSNMTTASHNGVSRRKMCKMMSWDGVFDVITQMGCRSLLFSWLSVTDVITQSCSLLLGCCLVSRMESPGAILNLISVYRCLLQSALQTRT